MFFVSFFIIHIYKIQNQHGPHSTYGLLLQNLSPVIFPNGSALLLYRYGGGTPYNSHLRLGFADDWKNVSSYVQSGLYTILVSSPITTDNTCKVDAHACSVVGCSTEMATSWNIGLNSVTTATLVDLKPPSNITLKFLSNSEPSFLLLAQEIAENKFLSSPACQEAMKWAIVADFDKAMQCPDYSLFIRGSAYNMSMLHDRIRCSCLF